MSLKPTTLSGDQTTTFEVHVSSLLVKPATHTHVSTLTVIGQDRVFFEDCDGRQFRDADFLGGTQWLLSENAALMV